MGRKDTRDIFLPLWSVSPLRSGGDCGTGAPRSSKAPTPLGSPWVPKHRATVWSYREFVSCERGAPVAASERGGDNF